MLLCRIINKLIKSIHIANISFFFCQATDACINNTTAVLQGLIYLLVDQQPSLILYIYKKYDYTKKNLFEDANAWVALYKIFTNILQDSNLNSTYLIINILNEYIVDLLKLLDFIVQKLFVSPRVK
jgi:hypothetical protein